MPKGNSEVYPTFLTCVWLFLLKYDLFCPKWSYQGQNYQNVPKNLNEKLWPYHLSCSFNSFLDDPANKVWIFGKFIFDLEAFCGFKFTGITVRHVISLKKNDGVISKYCCLISWSPICFPAILVSASAKIVGPSATVTYNSMRVSIPGKLLYKGKRFR